MLSDPVAFVKGQVANAWDVPNIRDDRLQIKPVGAGDKVDMMDQMTLGHYNVQPDQDVWLVAKGGGGASKRTRPAVVSVSEKIEALIDAVKGQEFFAVDSQKMDQAQLVLERGSVLMVKLAEPSSIDNHIRALDADDLAELIKRLDALPKGGMSRYSSLAKLASAIFEEIDGVEDIAELCKKARLNLINLFNGEFAKTYNKTNATDMAP